MDDVQNVQTEQQNEEQTNKQDVSNDGAKKPESTKTFTQEELDEIIAKRLERERKKYADYEELKAKLAEYEKQEEERKRAEMSEIQRLQADLQAKIEAEQALQKQLSQLQETIKQEKIRNAFIVKAQSAGIAYVEDAYRLADFSGVEVDEDGNVKGIDAVVEQLVKNKPFLLAEEKKQPKQIGDVSGGQKRSDKTKEQLLAEAAEKARKSGRIEDLAAYAKLKRELGL